MTDHISAGDLVHVPWGFENIRAIVRDIYGPPAHPMALVEVEVPGASGEALQSFTFSLSLDEVTPIRSRRNSSGSRRRGKRATASRRRRAAG